MVLISLALFGNYYVYDAIGPIADLFHFTDTRIGKLNSIYSLPDVVPVLVRCRAHHLEPPHTLPMAAGRPVFGMGSQTLNISPTIGIANHIGARHLALAMGVTLGADRLGSNAAYMSTEIFAPSCA